MEGWTPVISVLRVEVCMQALAYAEPLEQATARHARAWKVHFIYTITRIIGGCPELQELIIATNFNKFLFNNQTRIQKEGESGSRHHPCNHPCKLAQHMWRSMQKEAPVQQGHLALDAQECTVLQCRADAELRTMLLGHQ